MSLLGAERHVARDVCAECEGGPGPPLTTDFFLFGEFFMLGTPLDSLD